MAVKFGEYLLFYRLHINKVDRQFITLFPDTTNQLGLVESDDLLRQTQPRRQNFSKSLVD